MTTSVLKGGHTEYASRPRARWLRYWPLLLLAPLVYPPLVLSPYAVQEITMMLVFTCAIMGFNLLTGYLGQISLGHGAFLAIGGYATAIVHRDIDVPVVVAVLAGVGVTFVLGLVVGILVLRVQGVYLALITLAIAVATPPLIKRFPDLTGGSQGITINVEPPDWFGLESDQMLYFAVLTVVVAMYAVVRLVVRGRSGRSLAAIKDSELVARSMGVNLALVKTLVFALSAALCGLGGALYAIVVGFVSPESFGLLLSANLLAAMVIGGGGMLAGPLIGAAFYQYLPVVAGEANPSLGGLIYGLALIIVMLVAPKGVAGLPALLYRGWAARKRVNGHG